MFSFSFSLFLVMLG